MMGSADPAGFHRQLGSPGREASFKVRLNSLGSRRREHGTHIKDESAGEISVVSARWIGCYDDSVLRPPEFV
jgi:hypothetical protein